MLLSAVPAFFQDRPSVARGPEVTSPGAEDGVAATIGFGGADMHGALTLFADRGAWKYISATCFDLEPESDSILTDMVGEISNMLLGRYRNLLLREGVEVLSAIPVTAHGPALRVRHGRREALQRWHSFTCAGGSFWVRLEVAFREGFALRSSTATGATPIEPHEADWVAF